MPQRLPYMPAMKLKLFLSIVVIVFSFAFRALAQNNLELEPNDSIGAILQRQVGQVIELRISSGEKIGGKLEKVNGQLAHLSQLTGAEYFSAAVVIDDISAVLVRTKK